MTSQCQIIVAYMEQAFEANEPDVNRRNILLHALDVFVQKGLRDARIQDIAEHAGFSQGYVYRYYRSKEHIFARLMELAGQGAGDTVRYAAALPGPPWQRIQALAEAMLNPTSIAMQHWKLLAVQSGVPQAALDEHVQAAQRTRGLPVMNLIPLLQEAQRDGSVIAADPLMLAIAFFSMLQGLGLARTQLREELPFPDAALVLKFLRPIPTQTGRENGNEGL